MADALGLSLPPLVEVLEAFIVLVEVLDLDPVDLALLHVLKVILDDRIHVLQYQVRLPFVLNVARVQLELRKDLLVLARLKRLLERSILSNEIHGRTRVGLDLSDQVRKLNTVALLRLVYQLVH